MNRARLEHAITVMERVRDERLRFNMICWVAYESDPYTCNTAACFAGWCARDPLFREAGLRLEEGTPMFWDSHGANAISDFFDIPYGLARRLVHLSGYLGWPVSHRHGNRTPAVAVGKRRGGAMTPIRLLYAIAKVDQFKVVFSDGLVRPGAGAGSRSSDAGSDACAARAGAGTGVVTDLADLAEKQDAIKAALDAAKRKH